MRFRLVHTTAILLFSSYAYANKNQESTSSNLKTTDQESTNIESINILSTKEQATSVLSKNKRLFGNKLDNIRNKWKNICKFDSVEAMEHFKDELEETSLPEEEVDNFERCVSRCAWGDFFKDFVDRAYEEKLEESEKSDVFKPACSHCIPKIPKSLGVDYTKTIYCIFD